MIGIWALGAYLAVILLWTTVLKRSVGEAMILGFMVVLPFTGAAAGQVGWAALYSAVTDEIVYATMAFVFMGYLLDKTGVLDRLIDLLNSLIGGVKGGPAWVSTVASAGLGGVVHNQAAIAATVGSVTIPWMEKSRLDKPSAATLVAGNAGMGITFPFSASMFVLVGSATVGPLLDVNDLVLPLLIGGPVVLPAPADRHLAADPQERDDPAGCRPPAAGPGSVQPRLGDDAAVRRRGHPADHHLRRHRHGIVGLDRRGHHQVRQRHRLDPGGPHHYRGPAGQEAAARQRPRLVGAAARTPPRGSASSASRCVFAFAGANALAATGLPEQMTHWLNQMNLPLWLLAILIGLIVIAVAAPLSATATMAAVGTVGVATLVAAGVPATTAAVAVLVFSSCEAAVPPGGAPLYVACGIADVDPVKTFARLLTHYALPLLGIGVLIIVGVLPV